MIVDLVMWTHNSGKNLYRVLERINQVIPKECIGQKIISDDSSKDQTVSIAKKCGWVVYQNKGKGLKDNIKSALSLVSAPFFASFEHDVLLNRGWWNRMSKLMNDSTIAVAQGIRLSTNLTFRKLEEYHTNHHITDYTIDLSAQHQSLDNTLCRTSLIRQVGEYNETNIPGVIRSMGWRWFVDHSIVSDHLRDNFFACMQHDSMMSVHATEQPNSRWLFFRLALTSPLRSIRVACETKYPLLFFLYPIYRVNMLLGVLKR